MKLNKIFLPVLFVGALIFTNTASALYIDVGAAGGVGDTLLESTPLFVDADTKTGSIDSISFNVLGGVPLQLADSGVATGLNMTDIFDSDKELIGFFGAFHNLLLDYNSLTSSISLAYNNGLSDVNVATLDMINFNSNSGFVGSFTSVLNGFWFLDNGAALTNDLIANSTGTIDMAFNASNTSIDVGLVPEPSILALFGLGLIGVGFSVRRKQSK